MKTLVIRCGDFLASYRDGETGLPLPSYDLWEEKWGIHTFTVSAVYAGLKAAENFTKFFGNAKRSAMYKNAAEEVKAAMDTYLYSKEHNRFLKTIIPDKKALLRQTLPLTQASMRRFISAFLGLMMRGL